MTTPKPRARPWLLRLVALTQALLIAVIWGSIVQTQFNVAALEAMGAAVSNGQRLQVTASDLIGFTPIYAVIVLLGLLCAFPVAAFLARSAPSYRLPLFALAGMTGIATAIRIVDVATPAPTLIAATRGVGGWLLMAAGGALAGWWFARRTAPRSN
jgi:hypothetical protein